MQLHIATPDTPPPPYWERTEGMESAIVEFVASGDLYHIEDETGEDRRIAEGWCSLGGIDWEDEEVRSSVLLDAVETYARKNPIILWDHQRDKPIGELLEWEVTDKGLFVRFRIFDARDFDDPDDDLLALCNRTWSLVRRGLVRGLSWDGRARKRWVWSDDLCKHIKQPVEVLMSEITVTPIQVHPGAKITGTTLSKALRICKALRIGGATYTGDNEMKEKLKAAQEAQRALAEALGELPDGTELPEEMLEFQEGITKAMGIKPAQSEPPKTEEPPANDLPGQSEMPEAITEAITKALAPMQQKLDAQAAEIAKLTNEAAPLRRQVSHDDTTGSHQRPNSEGGEPTFTEQISKALHVGSQVRAGRLERGTGEQVRISGPDLMGAHMALNGMALNWPEKRHQPEITLTGLAPLMQ